MKVGNYYAYRINPIDFGWEYLRSVSEHRKHLADRFAAEQNPHERENLLREVSDFEKFTASALEAGSQLGWEGDFRIPPHVGFLPAENEMSEYCVWKQDNNGDTFVVSRLELPWLDEISY